MLARLIRSVVAGAAVVALTACGGDDNSPPAPDPVVGSWSLTSIDGADLPIEYTVPGGTYIISDGTAQATDNGNYTATYNATLNGIAEVTEVTGTWSRSGAGYTIAGTLTRDGVVVGPTSSTGTVSGNRLTLEGGDVTEEWTRQ